MGGSLDPYWIDAIQTTYHNTTNEFNNVHHAHLVQFLFKKSELIELAQQKAIAIGTYAQRDPDSLLPFEIDIRFQQPGFAKPIKAYQRWSESAGVQYEDNPFYA